MSEDLVSVGPSNHSLHFVSPSGFTIILHLDLLATTHSHSQQQIHYKPVFAFTQDQTV
jgi:hypothetical protein